MDHSHHQRHVEKSHVNLAVEATSHCLLGCGLGDVFGVALGTFLGLPYLTNIFIGLVLGFFFGYILGIYPLLNNNMHWKGATKIVLTTETMSIVVMEIAEALTEWHFPGMKKAGLTHLTYWLGLFSALFMGFLAAFPVNLYLVKRGIRHQH